MDIYLIKVDKIVDTVEVVCAQQGLDLASVRTGFHWPPFNTVNHLHLHVIAPVESMGFLQRVMFKPDSFWFVSVSRRKIICASHLCVV